MKKEIEEVDWLQVIALDDSNTTSNLVLPFLKIVIALPVETKRNTEIEVVLSNREGVVDNEITGPDIDNIGKKSSSEDSLDHNLESRSIIVGKDIDIENSSNRSSVSE